MSSNHEQPEQGEANSQESMPQVVVRAGKYFLCSSCGTLVEVPEEFVGQLMLTTQPIAEQPADAQSGSQVEPSQSEPTTQTPPQPMPPRRSKHPKFNGQIIDGLKVPSASELDRSFAWVSFHLTVLDRQGSELKRLKKLLKKRLPSPPQSGPSCADRQDCAASEQDSCDAEAASGHHQENLGTKPEPILKRSQQKERGPP